MRIVLSDPGWKDTDGGGFTELEDWAGWNGIPTGLIFVVFDCLGVLGLFGRL